MFFGGFLTQNPYQKHNNINEKDIIDGSEKVNLSNLNDPLCTQHDYSYNHSLAKESLVLASAAYSAGVSSSNWGENLKTGREDNIKNILYQEGTQIF